jgi:ectoine hydroxylase-related dioxygenase (phytanoyl-CoA dioxygenase family)
VKNNSRCDLGEVRRCYNRDGAAVLRGAISEEWINRLADATDAILSSQGPGMTFSKPGEGRFFTDMFCWLRVPEYKAFIFESGLSGIVSDILSSKEVRFFYDQLLVKEPGTPKHSPWHHDRGYWPVSGEQIITSWIPLDAATPETGVVTYVKGSHRWNASSPLESWSDNEAIVSGSEPAPGGMQNAELSRRHTVADVNSDPQRYEFITWNVEPGDIIVHHGLTIHGAPGNLSPSRRRRAISMRWIGDDIRWDGSRPNFLELLRDDPAIDFPYPSLKTGDVFDGPLFPKVWPI